MATFSNVLPLSEESLEQARSLRSTLPRKKKPVTSLLIDADELTPALFASGWRFALYVPACKKLSMRQEMSMRKSLHRRGQLSSRQQGHFSSPRDKYSGVEGRGAWLSLQLRKLGGGREAGAGA